MDTRAGYRELVNNMGKKEFTFLKMQEYGFWPSNLPTPYERQQNESEQDFENRKKLLDEFQNFLKKYRMPAMKEKRLKKNFLI